MKKHIEDSITEITDRVLNQYRNSITRSAFVEAMEHAKGLLVAPSMIEAIDVIANQVLDKYRNSVTRDAFIEAMDRVKNIAFESPKVTMETSGFNVPTYEGTWYAIDQMTIGDRTLFLMEHEEYGDETEHIIVDQNGVFVMGDIWNGFDDYLEAMDLEEGDLSVFAVASKDTPAEVATPEPDERSSRLFVDMDGTLARFHDEVQYLERMYEPGFFRDLKPFRGAVESVREFMRQHPNVEVYILSSAIPGYPPGCVQQKQTWLDKYLPEIDHEHRLFPEMGTDKSTVIPGGIRATDVLLDDYNKNLEEWRQAGGQSVKFVNNINDKALIGERWKGDRMYHDAGIQDNVRFLAEKTGADQMPPSQQRGAHL